jgi:hypothetical protein
MERESLKHSVLKINPRRCIRSKILKLTTATMIVVCSLVCVYSFSVLPVEITLNRDLRNLRSAVYVIL